MNAPARSGRGTFQGVCSSYLLHQPEGSVVYAFAKDTKTAFRLPGDPLTPIIMVGAGTGLAPFRGFLQERAALKASGASLGPSMLFFGCRHPQQDLIYESELRRFVAEGVTGLEVACSRVDESRKTYASPRARWRTPSMTQRPGSSSSGPSSSRTSSRWRARSPRCGKIVALGEHPRHESYETWTSRRPAVDPAAASAPDDVAMQIYTSGTTGLPKGAMLTNRNLGTLIPCVAPQWAFDTASVNIVAMPLFHIGGSGWALVGMWHGGHSILFREFSPPDVLAAIPRYGVTNALFVAAMLQFLSATPGAADGDYSTLRTIVYGASPITNDVLLRSMKVFRCDFIHVYGLTESTGAITQLDAKDHDPEGPRARLLRSAGKPYPWVEMRIVDPDTASDCPRGVVGELWTRSVQNMKGYWNKPDDTAKTFAPEGWLKTGDAGFLDEDGDIFLTDRVKDMIVSGGENVYPVEVENVLAEHPAIADVGVIGVPDAKWGETVKAIVVSAPGASPTLDEIIAFARERLARYKCPTSVDFVDALPRNPSGKILKRVLREPYWQGHERRVH